MSKYNAQQTVHLLPIPFCTAEIINSYLFIEIKTFIEEKKTEIVDKFKNACCSRKYPNDIYDNDNSDNCEHWSICLDHYELHIDTINEIQFQAINCKICGNYKMSSKCTLPKKLECYC